MISPISQHKGQLIVYHNNARHKVIVCGRRWGKSLYGCEWLLEGMNIKNSRNIYTGPTRDDAKEVAWDYLKTRCRQLGWKIGKNDTELKIERLRKRSIIKILTAEKENKHRGKGNNRYVLDEYSLYRNPKLWSQAIRPSLSDRKGKALFLFIPKGLNHAYDLAMKAKTDPNWAFFSFKTLDSPFFQTPDGKAEIEEARKDLDEKTFKQEYEASFEAFEGLIYYSFDREKNHIDYNYDPDNGPIIIGADFNRSPMSWALFQKVNGKLYAFDELFIKFSNTEECCKIIKKKYPDSHFIVRPDATGRRKTSNSALSDFDIIRDKLTMQIDVDNLNPRVIDRWTSVNRALEKKLILINTAKCPKLTKDFETLAYKEGTCEPNLSDPMAGHITDGAGYAIYREFPIVLKRKSRIIDL